MKVLLLTPPMTQLNTAYPATAYLTGFLRKEGFEAIQADCGLDLVYRLLSANTLAEIHLVLQENTPRHMAESVRFFLDHFSAYSMSIDPVLRFLQGRDPTLCHRICQPGFLPCGPRFKVIREMQSHDGLLWAFGEVGLVDRAKFLATLFIEDIADAIREGIDGRFELSRYAESLAASAVSFDPILEDLARPPTLVGRCIDSIAEELIQMHAPEVVGISVPFPGNLYGGLRIAKRIKQMAPATRVVMGGGYVNTELRELSDPRFFDWVDFLTFDDGERPLLCIINSLRNRPMGLVRTMVCENERVVLKNDATVCEIALKDRGTPTYSGLPMDRYLSLCDFPNPMHRLWSDGRWNKLTLAHGCYWRRCAFCDTSLDYISRYETQKASEIVGRMEQLIRETGQSGFHFVDEAAAPAMLGALADELLARGLVVSWWTNIRFEKTFTYKLAAKLSRSGCIAVSGGLEVASDRLLRLMDKGVGVDQVARVTHAFRRAGILVHAYLMFGFPTQTVAETVDSLERVRQLFEQGCIQSAYWHRFSATVHSAVAKDPGRFGISIAPNESAFARNDVAFTDSTGIAHERLHPGLKKALYNYMYQLGLGNDVRSWFDFPVPQPRVSKHWLTKLLEVD